MPKEETPAGDGWSGWRYAQDSEGNGMASFVDVPIYHPVFGGKYDDHPAIDLPHWFCTMSGAEFLDAQDVWHYATMQPNTNIVGPLGKRAGLDIKEHYPRILKFDLFADAKIWIQVGCDDEDTSFFTQEDIDSGTMSMCAAYRALTGRRPTTRCT
jgi:hypothetical protein